MHANRENARPRLRQLVTNLTQAQLSVIFIITAACSMYGINLYRPMLARRLEVIMPAKGKKFVSVKPILSHFVFVDFGKASVKDLVYKFFQRGTRQMISPPGMVYERVCA